MEQGFIGYYDNDDGSEHDDHDGDDFTVFMIVVACMLMIKTFNNENEIEVNTDISTEVAAS